MAFHSTESVIEMLAFSQYLLGWYTDEEDPFDDLARLERLSEKWKKEWLTSLTDPHCGDCTDMPMACTRCHTEEFLRQGKILYESLSAANKITEEPLIPCTCGKSPVLAGNVTGGFHYECCGIVGSFPPVSTERRARNDWNHSH